MQVVRINCQQGEESPQVTVSTSDCIGNVISLWMNFQCCLQDTAKRKNWDKGLQLRERNCQVLGKELPSFPQPKCFRTCIFKLKLLMLHFEPTSFSHAEKSMATHCSVLAWKIPWTEEPGGLPSMGSTESDTTEAIWQQQQHLALSFGTDRALYRVPLLAQFLSLKIIKLYMLI